MSLIPRESGVLATSVRLGTFAMHMSSALPTVSKVSLYENIPVVVHASATLRRAYVMRLCLATVWTDVRDRWRYCTLRYVLIYAIPR